MPIYAYRCASCAFADDVLQKVSDTSLTKCPKCGQDTFQRQITAPQFQLKGTGWYVTDFRNGPQQASKKQVNETTKPQETAEPAAGKAAEGKTDNTAHKSTESVVGSAEKSA